MLCTHVYIILPECHLRDSDGSHAALLARVLELLDGHVGQAFLEDQLVVGLQMSQTHFDLSGVEKVIKTVTRTWK